MTSSPTSRTTTRTPTTTTDDDYDGYVDHDDRRWLWVASVAGIVLLIAVAGTMMILSGGDSGTTSATVSPSTSSPAPLSQRRAVHQRAGHRRPPRCRRRPSPASHRRPPPRAQRHAEPTEAAPPPAADPRTVTYTVTGNRQLFDLVTIIYTDEQGALQTDVNVALPWTKQVVLDPGVAAQLGHRDQRGRSAQLLDHRRGGRRRWRRRPTTR